MDHNGVYVDVTQNLPKFVYNVQAPINDPLNNSGFYDPTQTPNHRLLNDEDYNIPGGQHGVTEEPLHLLPQAAAVQQQPQEVNQPSELPQLQDLDLDTGPDLDFDKILDLLSSYLEDDIQPCGQIVRKQRVILRKRDKEKMI